VSRREGGSGYRGNSLSGKDTSGFTLGCGGWRQRPDPDDRKRNDYKHSKGERSDYELAREASCPMRK